MAAIQVDTVFEMDAWMNRYRAFAEGVVVMVCPVILSIALDKVNLKSEEHGRAIPVIILVVAAITLIAGICPFLICRFPSERTGPPHTVVKCLVLLSSACLVALACWIHFIIFHNWTYPVIGAVIGLCILVPTARYFWENAAASNNEKRRYSKLENSLDLVAGITALLFLGLESLALEGQIKATKDPLIKPLGASFFACIFGACLMLLETTPLLIKDHNIISEMTKCDMTKFVDVLMTFALSLVMFFITQELMKIQALLVFAPSFLILMVFVYHLTFANNAQNTENKPASIELTKVTFTGFLAVSIPSISKGLKDKGTQWFILLAAAAIVSGLVWRLLTHNKSDSSKKTASVASFCTHLLIVVAAIPFTVMAGNVLS